MSLDNRITRYLDREGVPYRLIEHPEARPEEAMRLAGLSAEKLLRVQVLQHRHGLFIAVLPVTHLIDFAALRAKFDSRPEPLPAERLGRLFNDCQSGCVSPLGAPYGLPGVVDEAVARMGEVYLQAGDQRHLLAIEGEELMRIGNTLPLGRISHRPAVIEPEKPSREELIRRRSEALKQLPPMPQTARRLMLLRNAEEPDVQALAAAVSEDPAISAQLLAYARSSYFGFGGRIQNVEEAISLVLGFDMALSTALALTAASPYKLPQSGRLGLENYWRRSLLGATLAQALCAHLPRELGVRPGQAYLSNLLRDFGLLVMGQTLEEDYRHLAVAMDKGGDEPLEQVERRLLGFTHAQIGGWVLRRWGLPTLLSQVAAEHHNPKYQGEHAAYVALAQLTDALLDEAETLPEHALKQLGIDADTARRHAAELLSGSGALQGFAQQLAA